MWIQTEQLLGFINGNGVDLLNEKNMQRKEALL